MRPVGDPDEQRLDKWLWHARITKSRNMAAKLIEQGLVRINRQRVLKPSASVKRGDVLTASFNGRIRVIEILAIGSRRGPPIEAKALYAERLADELPSQLAQ